MWFHIRVAAYLLRSQWIGIGLRMVASSVVVLGFMLCWWIGFSVMHDIDRMREAVTIDIVMNPDVSDEDLNNLAESIRKRPDVLEALVLDSHDVWHAFQRELGVHTSGLVELSTLPSVLQLRLRAPFVSRQHVHAFRDAILHAQSTTVDHMLVPETSVIRLEQRKHEAQDLFVTAAVLFAIAAFASFFWQFRALHDGNLHAIAGAHGRGWLWANAGSLLVSVVAMSIAKFIAFGALFLVTAEVANRAPWLLPLGALWQHSGL